MMWVGDVVADVMRWGRWTHVAVERGRYCIDVDVVAM